MKKFVKINLVVFLVLACVFAFGISAQNTSAAYAETSQVELLDASSEFLTQEYWDLYSIPTSQFSYANNGGNTTNNELKKAFDRNLNTIWQSGFDNLYDEQKQFLNVIEVNFNQAVSVDRIIYGSELFNGGGRGYPVQFTVYAKVNNEYVKVGYWESSETTSMVMFKLDSATTCTGLKLEYTKVTTNHKWYATAREIVLLQPENGVVKQVQTLFTDYNQLTLKTDTDAAKIESLRQQIKNLPNNEVLSDSLDRAELVLNNKISYDPRREMTTDPDGKNVIARHGNVADYARNTLKMTWYGTNRQPTGISLNAGQTLDIYVTGDDADKDKLPRIRTTQFWGHWSSWISQEYQLKMGKNTITMQNFITDSYSIKNIVAGGPVYIVNPYLESEQSANIKVYFEGGTLIPVYHMGADEQEYKLQLNEYASKVKANPETMVDVTEMVSNHFIMTVRATVAAPIYETKSPNDNLVYWDNYMEQVLKFDGVKFSETNDDLKEKNFKYDERSKYLNCNIRLMQPYGAAYAYTEHVGIQPDWEGGAIYSQSNGWGYTHELGHMMDNGERTVSECSNNMMSKFDETALEQEATRGEFARTLAALSPDDENRTSFWNVEQPEGLKRMNYLVWWLIESYDIGFWGRMENCYRYIPSDTTTGLTDTEKQVYFCSLATGIDLSYYFERWGYNLKTTDPEFKASTTSPKFNQLMAEAKAQGKIDDSKQPKIWYLDAKQYLENEAGHTTLYHGTENVSINSISKTSSGYSILINENYSKNPAHLGYEILANNRVVGFTYTNNFVDTNGYASAPTYKIRAYDRALNYSLESASASVTIQSEVCKLNNVKYNSIADAISAATAGDTIYLLKDVFESNIVVDKNINIEIDGSVNSAITISKSAGGAVFVVNGAATLTIAGTENKNIVIDGNSFAQEGALFNVEGVLKLEHVTLQNNINSKDGGAITFVGTGGRREYLLATHTTFKNNQANNGGAVYNSNAVVNAIFENCTFENNLAKNAAGIYNSGTFTFNSCVFEGNEASGNGGALANVSGGIIKVSLCTFNNNKAENGAGLYIDGNSTLESCQIYSNMATNFGGGIYYSGANWARSLSIKTHETSEDATNIYSNIALLGAAIYVNMGSLEIDAEIYSNTNSDPDSAEIYFKSGSATIVGQSKINNNIFKGENAQVSVINSMFNSDNAIEIVLDNYTDNFVLLTATNFNFINTDLQNIKLKFGTAVLNDEGNQILTELPTVQITIAVGENSSTTSIELGSKIVLGKDSGISGKYVDFWLDSSNQRVEAGSEIVVIKSETYTAQLGDMFKISFVYDQISFDEYVIPDEPYYLPNFSLEKTSLIGWQLSEKIYLPNTKFDVSSNLEFNAIFIKKLQVRIDMQGQEIENKFCEYKDSLTLENVPEIPKGYKLSYFLVNGKRANLGEKVEITKDTTITIVLAKQPNRTLIVAVVLAGLAAISVCVVAVVLKVKKHKKVVKNAKKK